MDICARRGCQHLLALHAGRTGKCRLNGCRCDQFTLPRPAVTVAPVPVRPKRDALPGWLTFLGGALVGFLLGMAQ